MGKLALLSPSRSPDSAWRAHSAAEPATVLEAVLGCVRGAMPVAPLVEVVCGADVEAGRQALEASVSKGRIVRDECGWVRLNPVFRRRSLPAVSPIALRAVERACGSEPASLALQVARLSLVSWDSPAIVAEVEAFFARVRWGLRARELVEMLDKADLLGVLIEVAPRSLLALMIEGGRAAQARPVVGHDRFLRAMLALEDRDTDAARSLLDGLVGLPVRFLRLRVFRTQFDYDALEAELAHIPEVGLSPIDTLRRAYYTHRLFTFRGRWAELPEVVARMRAAAERTEDGSLMCRVVEATLTQTVRRGDLMESKALITELERLIGQGWSPGLRSRLALLGAYIADLEGDHLELEAALARPFHGEAYGFLRRLQVGGLMMLRGQSLDALEVPEIQSSVGSLAQYLAEVGRFEEALAHVDARPAGFTDQDLLVLRGPIAARLGVGQVVELWAHATPYQVCKLSWGNTLAALHEGKLDDARRWTDRGLETASRFGLWGLGARLLVMGADVACRQGRVDDALAMLDRYDSLRRHPEDFRTNMVTVARLRIAGEPPDAELVDRLVRQHDVEALAVLAADHPVPPAAEVLLQVLPEVASDQLEACFLQPAGRKRICVASQGRSVRFPDGRSLDLRRSGAPRRVLLALLAHRRDRSGECLDADALIQLGWPGEKILWDSARTRLYTVIRRLRARGVEALETVDGGYRISPEVDVVFEDGAV